MLDFDSVVSNFSSFSGLDIKQSKQFSNIINLSISYVLRNLKPTASPSSHKDILSMVAASIAYHKYCLIQQSVDKNSSIKLGDVSIQSDASQTTDASLKLQNEFISLASDILDFPHFIFKQVP